MERTAGGERWGRSAQLHGLICFGGPTTRCGSLQGARAGISRGFACPQDWLPAVLNQSAPIPELQSLSCVIAVTTCPCRCRGSPRSRVDLVAVPLSGACSCQSCRGARPAQGCGCSRGFQGGRTHSRVPGQSGRRCARPCHGRRFAHAIHRPEDVFDEVEELIKGSRAPDLRKIVE